MSPSSWRSNVRIRVICQRQQMAHLGRLTCVATTAGHLQGLTLEQLIQRDIGACWKREIRGPAQQKARFSSALTFPCSCRRGSLQNGLEFPAQNACFFGATFN
jgi:hypothetical protein